MAVTEHVSALHDDDATLVLAVQLGDREAYAELFRRHYPAVRRACARRLRDVTEADEIAQASFVRALERIDRCGGERRFGAWVQVIAQRLCIDTIRAQARTMPREDPLDGEREIGPNGPEDRVLDLDRASTLWAALSTLPPRQRDVVIARDVEERRPPEIAAALGLSIGAVDSLLLRARRRLAGAYRAAAGEQGVSTATSSAAVAGTTIAAGNHGLVEAIVSGVRAVRDAVAHVPALVAAAPAAPAASSGARKAAATAVAAVLSFGGIGAGGGAPAEPPPLPPVASVPALPGGVAVPAAPETPAPSPPDRPDLGSLWPAAPAPMSTPLPGDVTGPAAPTAPVLPQPPAATAPADAVGGVTDTVTDAAGVLADAVAGTADALNGLVPVG